jgi:hypothetical protein
MSTSSPGRGGAERVLLVSLMKSGTHLVQELMVALGYGVYGSSRIPPEIQPALDAETQHRMLRMVHGEEACRRLAAGDAATFQRAAQEAWEALGWAWQLRLGMPLESRYGTQAVSADLVQQALARTVGTPFSMTPAGVCWVATELDVKKVDGAFLQEWSQTREPRIVYMYRDPRDMVLSMVNFLSGLTAQGFGNYSDFQVFNGILNGKASLEEKLTYALSDPAFPGSGDHERNLWLLHHPDVCKVSFEELVGPSGGGSAEAQRAAVARVAEFVGAEGDLDDLGRQLFRRDSFSFFKGQIGAWREVFTPRHRSLAAERLGAAIELYGYAA